MIFEVDSIGSVHKGKKKPRLTSRLSKIYKTSRSLISLTGKNLASGHLELYRHKSSQELSCSLRHQE